MFSSVERRIQCFAACCLGRVERRLLRKRWWPKQRRRPQLRGRCPQVLGPRTGGCRLEPLGLGSNELIIQPGIGITNDAFMLRSVGEEEATAEQSERPWSELREDEAEDRGSKRLGEAGW